MITVWNIHCTGSCTWYCHDVPLFVYPVKRFALVYQNRNTKKHWRERINEAKAPRHINTVCPMQLVWWMPEQEKESKNFLVWTTRTVQKKTVIELPSKNAPATKIHDKNYQANNNIHNNNKKKRNINIDTSWYTTTN